MQRGGAFLQHDALAARFIFGHRTRRLIRLPSIISRDIDSARRGAHAEVARAPRFRAGRHIGQRQAARRQAGAQSFSRQKRLRREASLPCRRRNARIPATGRKPQISPLLRD